MPQLEDLDQRLQDQLTCGIIPQLDENVSTTLLQLVQLDRKITNEDESELLVSDSSIESCATEYPTYSALLRLELNLKASRSISDGIIAPLLNLQNIDSEFEYYLFLRAFSLIIDNKALSSYWNPLMGKWHQFDRYPLRSNVLGCYFFEKITSHIAQDLKTTTASSELKVLEEKYASLFGSQTSPFARMIEYQCLFAYASLGKRSSSTLVHDISVSFIKYVEEFIHNAKFPKATQKTHSLDTLAYTLTNLNQKYNILSVEAVSVLEKALEKSFQSISVMKGIAVIASDKDELKSAVKVYLEYIHTQTIQHFGKYVDLMDVIDTLRTVLSRNVLVLSPEEGYETLRDLVYKFLGIYGITDASVLSLPLKQLLAQIWFDLGVYLKRITQFYYRDVSLVDNLPQIKDYFSKAEALAKSFPEKTQYDAAYFFEYSYSLVRAGEFKEALKHIKTAVKLNPNEIQYTNLLVLLYSSLDENKDKAFDVSTRVSESLIAYLHSTVSEYKTPRQKWHIMQFFMIHIAFVELKYDIYEAIELLPEFLTNMHTLLYSDLSASPVSNGNSGAQTVHNQTKSKTKVMDKFKNTTKHVVHPNGHTNGDVPNLAKGGKKQAGGKQDKVLQECWLWCAMMYQKAGMTEDAESCIFEAQSYSCNDGRVESALGLLEITQNRHKAIKEFEISLGKNERNNIESVVGLTTLSLEGEPLLKDVEKNVFIGPADVEAALGRCKIYLESLTTDYKTYQRPEVYYFLSKIYEVAGNPDKLEATLWKCVELEDYRPIRPWDIIDF